MAVGPVLKCLDFPGRDDCYIIGELLAYRDNDYYEVLCSVDVVEGVERDARVGVVFNVPVNGKAMFDDVFPGRVKFIA